MTTIIGCGIGIVLALVIGLVKNSLTLSGNTYGRRHIGRTARWNRRAR